MTRKEFLFRKNNKRFVKRLVLYLLIVPYMLIALVSWLFNFEIAMLFFGFVTALQIVVVLFLILSPYIAGFFTTTVDKPKHFPLMPLFARVESGRAKAVVDQGGNARRYVINKNDAGFSFDTSGGEDGKWNVVEDTNYNNYRNFWEKWVEDKVGLVFVGIYPFRSIYHYELHPIKILTRDGERKLYISKEASVSDHVRVREFNWGAQVKLVLKEMFQLNILFSFRLQCTNPHKLLFGVDSWDESFADAVTSRAIEVVQGMSLEEIMVPDGVSGAVKSRIANAVKEISFGVNPKTSENWGLKIIDTQISKYDFSDMSADERKSLTVVEVTKRMMEAKEKEYSTEASGEALVVSKRAEAIDGASAGAQASRDQMLETAAEKGQQTMITGLGDGKPADNEENTKLLKAILATLKKK